MPTSGALKHWARADRPREKLLDQGAAGLSAVELLAVLLRTGSEGETVLDQARALLDAAGHSLRGLARLGPARPLPHQGHRPGQGGADPRRWSRWRSASARRSSRPARRSRAATTSTRTSASVSALERHEHFYAVLLDNKNRKLKEIRISQGSLTASIVHPRDVYLPVIRESAAAVIFVHNHPSGDPTPSAEDIEITRRLRQVGELVGVRVLDHLIIGRGRYVSFVDDGYW